MATIMLVDDDKDVGELLAETLTDAGYTVDLFISGRDAIHASVDCRYALVITDINMPDINGLTMMRMIRAQRSHMPYIVMSAASAPEDCEMVKNAEGFHYKLDGGWDLIRKVEAVLILKGVDAGASQEVLSLSRIASGV